MLSPKQVLAGAPNSQEIKLVEDYLKVNYKGQPVRYYGNLSPETASYMQAFDWYVTFDTGFVIIEDSRNMSFIYPVNTEMSSGFTVTDPSKEAIKPTVVVNDPSSNLSLDQFVNAKLEEVPPVSDIVSEPVLQIVTEHEETESSSETVEELN